MLTSPVAQLISRWTDDLKVGGSRPVQDISKINLFSLVSDSSLADICVVVVFMLP